jgi:hypothetical protein
MALDEKLGSFKKDVEKVSKVSRKKSSNVKQEVAKTNVTLKILTLVRCMNLH